MSARLPSDILVGSLLRRANDGGGFGVVLARGDAQGGMILVVATEAGEARLLERGLGPSGAPALIESRLAGDGESIDDYWRRRRSHDPDLWVIELDIPNVERLVAETILGD